MRYEKGFKWSPAYGGLPHYDKILYIHNDDKDPKGCQVIPEWYGDRFSVASQGEGTRAHECSKKGTGWEAVMGGKESDGKWHCYEIHIKASSEGKDDGIGELWIDGAQQLSVRSAALPGKGWSWFLVGSNQNLPDNGRDVYVDYDDIAVSRSGYIGPIPAKPETNVQKTEKESAK
jgi:hypothetical protein